jgi:carbon monoxide dehydrogenase subunit G
MELTNDFEVDVPVPEAWKVLTDVERIAPLLPGAQLQEIDGDEYRGVVKVKVGPITAQYKGVATFVEKDEAAGKVVLKATGRDTRGQGNANALITAVMTPVGEGTKVSVLTDLTITGKVAQFGRGVLAEVSSKLLGQFVDSLHADIASGGGKTEQPAPAATAKKAAPAKKAAASNGDASVADESGSEESAPQESGEGGTASEPTVAPEEPSTSTGPRRIHQPDPEPVDLIGIAGGSAAKRLIPLGVVAILLLLLIRRRRVGRSHRGLAEVLS